MRATSWPDDLQNLNNAIVIYLVEHELINIWMCLKINTDKNNAPKLLTNLSKITDLHHGVEI